MNKPFDLLIESFETTRMGRTRTPLSELGVIIGAGMCGLFFVEWIYMVYYEFWLKKRRLTIFNGLTICGMGCLFFDLLCLNIFTRIPDPIAEYINYAQMFFLNGMIVCYSNFLYRRSTALLSHRMNKVCHGMTRIITFALTLAPFFPPILEDYWIFQVIVLFASPFVVVLDIVYLTTFLRFLRAKGDSVKEKLSLIATHSTVCTIFSLLTYITYAIFLSLQPSSSARISELIGYMFFNVIFASMFRMKEKIDKSEDEEIMTMKIKKKAPVIVYDKSTIHGEHAAGKTFLSRFII
jgi:hypothetical protein